MINIYWLSPEILMGTYIMGLSWYGVWKNNKTEIQWLVKISLVYIILGITIIIQKSRNIPICNDYFEVGIGLMIIKLSIVIVLLIYLTMKTKERIEVQILILINVIGIFIAISSKDLISLFIGIECISLTSYILAGINRKNEKSIEGGLKYFFLGGLSTGLFLFATVLIYGSTGETNLYNIKELYPYFDSHIMKISSFILIFSLIFKLGGAPFHVWLPDVYEGSKTFITGFFSIIPKIGILFVLIKLIRVLYFPLSIEIQTLFIFTGLLSILISCFTGLNQIKLKRIFAYSTIGHIGFILLGIGCSSLISLSFTFLYIFVYILLSLINFIILLFFINKPNPDLFDLHLLSRNNSFLSFLVSSSLLGTGGFPPFVGFLSKFLIIFALFSHQLYLPAVLALIFSIISLFFYWRFSQFLFFPQTSVLNIRYPSSSPFFSFSLLPALLLGFLFFFLISLLFYTFPLLIFSTSILL